MSFDFSPYAAVLLDLDGTIYHEDHPLPGAAELVAKLKGTVPYACLSNSTLSPAELAPRLARMGVNVDDEHIYTAGAAAADWVLEHFFGKNPRVFNLCTEGVQQMLQGKVQWVQKPDDRCDAIIVGTPVNRYATEDRRRIALELARHGATLVGTSADRVYPSPRGFEFGSGSLTHMIAYAANVQPVFTGKPLAIFFQELCRKLSVKPDRCILIGDSIESDLRGARTMDMKFIMTLTGITSAAELDRLVGDRRPDFVVNDLTELL